MRATASRLALLLTTAAAVPVAAQDAAEVRTVIEQHYAAIHANELEAVLEDHLPEMTWFPYDGRLLYESGNEASAERMGAVLDYGTANVYMNHFSAQIYGNVAVATFYLVGPRAVGGVTENIATRVTAVWVREGNQWREAHHHESRLVGAMGQ
jgi:ketosteroid isomerase-like protein